MPITRKKTAPRKASSTTAQMSPARKTIYAKLKRKGMSDKQALAFSHHAAKRKESAAAKKTTVTTKTASKKRAAPKTTARKKK